MVKSDMTDVEDLVLTLRLAFDEARKDNAMEHDTARYVNIFLMIIFPRGDWTILPQLRNKDQSGIPDLVLETFRIDRGSRMGSRMVNTAYFVRKIYVELKGERGNTLQSGIDQVVRQIESEIGESYLEQGFAIVIRGGQWLILEFNFGNDKDRSVGNRNQKMVNKLKLNPITSDWPDRKNPTKEDYENLTVEKYTKPFNAFTGFSDLIPKDKRRQWKSGSNKDLASYALSFEENFGLIIKILNWISITRGDYPRRWMKPTTNRHARTGSNYTMTTTQSLTEGNIKFQGFEELLIEAQSEVIEAVKPEYTLSNEVNSVEDDTIGGAAEE